MNQSDRSSHGLWVLFFSALAVILFFLLWAGPRIGVRSRPAIARLEILKASKPQTLPIKTEPISDPYFIQTEFERIRSDRVLTQVLANLRRVPGFAEHTRIAPETPLPKAIAQLRDLTTIRQARNTALMEIRVHSAHPLTSADIANQIASVYIAVASTNGVRVLLIDRAIP